MKIRCFTEQRQDKTVRIWDLNTFKSIRCLVGFQHPVSVSKLHLILKVNSVAFDPVGTNLVFAASGNSVRDVIFD